MPAPVLTGGLISCSFGVAPSPFMATPGTVKVGGRDAGTIMHTVPMLNIKPFGMCSSPANPMVVAATAAALGVLTPMPCVPATSAPWTPMAPLTLLSKMPPLCQGSNTVCNWGGIIQVVNPGSVGVQTS